MGGTPVASVLVREAGVATAADVLALLVRIDSDADHFVIEIPVGGQRTVEVWRNRIKQVLSNPQRGLKPGARGALLEASVMDRRLTVALDGVPLFGPIDYDDPALGPPPATGQSPLAFGVKGGTLTLSGVRVYRDVYYTSALAFTPRRPFVVNSPYRLGR